MNITTTLSLTGSSMFLPSNLSENWRSNRSMTLPPLELGEISQASLYSLYSVTILASVLGNSVVIFVLVKGRRSKKKLNAFLINLAVADLLMACFCMPYTFTETMLGRWVFGPVMCPLVSFVQVVSVAVSIFINMAIAIDRHKAVTEPFKEHITKIGGHIAITSIWVAALVLALPLLVTVRTYDFVYGQRIYQFCDEQWSETHRMMYTLVVMCVTYVIPLCVISSAYYRILTVLRHHTLPGNSDDQRDKQIMNSKKKVIKMLVIIILLFALSWLPIHLFTLIKDFFPGVLFGMIRRRRDELRMYAAFYSCHWLAMANSLVNPVVYSFMNDAFKADMRYLMRHKKLCGCVRPGRRSVRRSSTHTLRIYTNGKSQQYNPRVTTP